MASIKKSMRDSQVPGPLYYLDGVCVKFQKIEALKSIHLAINQNEKIFITGPSGAGKSTLLRVLAGLLKVNSGTFLAPDFNDKNGFYYPSMVFQDLKLMVPWTCEENLWVSYDPGVYDSKEEFSKDLMEYAKFFGIAGKLDMKLEKVNGGLKQKIAIIRALLTRPKILLADEPTSALDRGNALKLFEILQYLNEKHGLTVVWASHNRELIKQFSGRTVHLDGGRVIYTGHACFI